MDRKNRILQMSLAAVKTPALALGILAFVLAGGELAARSAFVRSRLGPPSVGSRARILDLQLAKLDELTAREGGMDCIFLGNSLVLFGLDPDSFSAAYEANAGSRLRTYNFSVPGIPVSGNAALAHILVEDYRPRLLIYGVTSRDFSNIADGLAIESIPWVRHRMGVASVDGWLVEHSRAYGYFLLSASELPAATERATRSFSPHAPRGFFGFVAAAKFDAAAFARAMDLLSLVLDRGVAPAQMSALGTLLKVRDNGTQLVFLEMPVRVDLSDWSAADAARYEKLMSEVRRALRDTGAPLWSPPAARLLPADGWTDLWHLNARGAEAFSRWVGERLAAAVSAGELPRPDGRPARRRPS